MESLRPLLQTARSFDMTYLFTISTSRNLKRTSICRMVVLTSCARQWNVARRWGMHLVDSILSLTLLKCIVRLPMLLWLGSFPLGVRNMAVMRGVSREGLAWQAAGFSFCRALMAFHYGHYFCHFPLRGNSIPPNKNPPASKWFSEKSTNCEVPFLKIHQLLCVHTAVGCFLDQALYSWWIFRISTSQLVDFY